MPLVPSPVIEARRPAEPVDTTPLAKYPEPEAVPGLVIVHLYQPLPTSVIVPMPLVSWAIAPVDKLKLT